MTQFAKTRDGLPVDAALIPLPDWETLKRRSQLGTDARQCLSTGWLSWKLRCCRVNSLTGRVTGGNRWLVDIDCGVLLLRSNGHREQIRRRSRRLADLQRAPGPRGDLTIEAKQVDDVERMELVQVVLNSTGKMDRILRLLESRMLAQKPPRGDAHLVVDLHLDDEFLRDECLEIDVLVFGQPSRWCGGSAALLLEDFRQREARRPNLDFAALR